MCVYLLLDKVPGRKSTKQSKTIPNQLFKILADNI